METEKTYDTKISVFLDTLTGEMKDYVKKSIVGIQKSIDDIRRTITHFKSAIQKQIDDFTSDPLENISKENKGVIKLQAKKLYHISCAE